jgi:hypothetical protein
VVRLARRDGIDSLGRPWRGVIAYLFSDPLHPTAAARPHRRRDLAAVSESVVLPVFGVSLILLGLRFRRRLETSASRAAAS